MFSCIFHGSSQCRLVLIASSFVSFFMLSGLSPVRDVKSAQEKGRMQYASDQKVASFGKKLWCFKCFEKEDDKDNDTSGVYFYGISTTPDVYTPVRTPIIQHKGMVIEHKVMEDKDVQTTPLSTPESTPTLTPLSTPMFTPLSTPVMEHKDVQKNATGCVLQ